MAYPSHVARGALRHALRTHPNADSVLNGRRVNDLTLDQLKAGLDALGVDHDGVTATALRAVGAVATALKAHRAKADQNDQDNQDDQETTPMDTTDTNTVDAIDTTIDATIAAAIESEVQTIRSLIMTGGFGILDDRLRALVTEARKPPVEVRVEVPIEVPMLTAGARPVHVAKQTGQSETWRKLFDVAGTMAKRTTAMWDGSHPDTPKVNDKYVWPHPGTEVALSQLARGRNVMLYGPAGTGKTEMAQQIAARTGRPFALISCDTGTDASTLVGMTVPDASGGVTWQDGQLTRAIQTPGCVVCLDEPSVARPGALFVMQNVLANRQLFIAETGRRVCVAPGVIFLTTDNTNGTGGGSRKGYTDTNRLNAAFLDRFGVRVHVDYLPMDQEIGVICAYTGCPAELAQLLVSAATVTRAAANDQTLSHGIGLRRLLAWTELLIDGVDAEYAFQAAVLNCAAEQDVETLREQCLLAYDRDAVARALNVNAKTAPDPSKTNPTAAGRAAAIDFPDAP
jgi:cobaltochelatase CobS